MGCVCCTFSSMCVGAKGNQSLASQLVVLNTTEPDGDDRGESVHMHEVPLPAVYEHVGVNE